MLTLAKIQTYQKFQGDVDGYARVGGGGDASDIKDEDWFLIEQLLQGLHLIASQKASDTFATEIEQRLHASTADDPTRDALRRMAAHR